ncbi:Lactate utilization protein C [Dyadobacter sp. CECT 9275]|uniref:Lactate utilization protein C n=1 Tax=Dyadobacter helix TaxID=2822344 RepID=A0A916J9R3_9BACT|nr:LUD domain-containing protein [Dyadobacter sp. CECT 9275]CAG4993289.1 Lactate utilization protein C [Dyadobacter sp. CECT 9275]
MNARDKILSQVKANKPAATALPEEFTYQSDYSDTQQTFTDVLAAIYTEVISVKNLQELLDKAMEMYGEVVNRATTIPALLPWADFSLEVSDPHELELIEMAILRAEFGVAENGAVWISDQYLPHRALPFITQNLAFVIPRDALVNNMHEAYNRLQDTTGWGCFIAGPSKTADIEQSLVIGAHGARSMVIFLVDEL